MIWVWVSISVIAVWLLGLTIVVAGLIRYLASLELGRSAGPLPLATASFDFDGDGPVVGDGLPTPVREVLAQTADRRRRQLLFFLSPGCGTCLDVAVELGRRRDLLDTSAFFVLGVSKANPATAAELLDALRPASEVVTGDDARTTLQGLGISSLPFVVAVSDERVTGKLFVRRIAQLDEFLDRFTSPQPKQAIETTGRVP